MEIEKMRRKSDRHGAYRHNGHKSQHRYSTESLNTSMQHRLIRETKRGKEDSVVGCHLGRRDFGSRGALRQIYASTAQAPHDNFRLLT